MFCFVVLLIQEKFKKNQTQGSVFTKLPIGSTQSQDVTSADPQRRLSRGTRLINCAQCNRCINAKPELIHIEVMFTLVSLFSRLALSQKWTVLKYFFWLRSVELRLMNGPCFKHTIGSRLPLAIYSFLTVFKTGERNRTGFKNGNCTKWHFCVILIYFVLNAVCAGQDCICV